MGLLIGTALFCAVTLALTGIVLWVRRPGARGLAASGAFHSFAAIAAVALWTAGLGLVAQGLVAGAASTGAYSLGALALVAVTVAVLRTLRPLRRLAAYDGTAANVVPLEPNPSAPAGQAGGISPTRAPASRKAA